MEDRAKIEAKIKQLNGGKNSGSWDEVTDFTMMPKVRFDNATKNYTVFPTEGISVKIFINTDTGETQMYWADKFMKE